VTEKSEEARTPIPDSFIVPKVGASTLLIRLSLYRLFIASFALLVGLIVGIYSALLPPVFTAYARLLPPQTNTATASSLLSQIGGTATLGASALTVKNPSDLYASLFYSRAVQDDVIERFNLAERYKQPDIDLLRTEIGKRTKVEVGKDSIITLAYTDSGSQSSALIANAMLDAMYKIARRLAKTESQRRADYYDALVEEAKNHLSQSIEQLRRVEQETGLTRIKGQEEASSGALVELRGLIATREVELQKMLQTATAQHPEVIRTQSELAALRAQLNKIFTLKKNILPNKKVTLKSDLLVPFEAYSDLRAKVEPFRLEVDINSTVVEQLIRARALSKVDESRDFSVISVLDDAVAPTHKSGPRVFSNTVVATVIGLLIATMLAITWDVLFTDQARRERWNQVFRSFIRKRKAKTV
jgi:tyrosine-protein kinase Etk/Wzc